MPLKLGYFPSRGYAHPIRQLLYITNQEFENVFFPNFQGWVAKKQEIITSDQETPFVNFPYLIDGDFFLTETAAIPYYLAKKAGKEELLGKGLKDESRVREVMGVAQELMVAIVNWIFSDQRIPQLKKLAADGGKVRELYQRLSGYLGEKEFLVGYFTYADLVVSHYVRYGRNYCLSSEGEDPLRGLDNLFEHVKRVEALPQLQGFPHLLPYVPPGVMTWFKEFPLPQ